MAWLCCCFADYQDGETYSGDFPLSAQFNFKTYSNEKRNDLFAQTFLGDLFGIIICWGSSVECRRSLSLIDGEVSVWSFGHWMSFNVLISPPIKVNLIIIRWNVSYIFSKTSTVELFCILDQIQPNWDFIHSFLKFETIKGQLLIFPSHHPSEKFFYDNLAPCITTAVQGAEPETTRMLELSK